MLSRIKKLISIFLCLSLAFEQSGLAQLASSSAGGRARIDLSAIISGINGSLATDKFRPLHLRFLSYDTLNNQLKLLLDKGDTKNHQEVLLKETAQELLNYFLVGVTLPNNTFWVNLRPDEEDNIIDPELEKTDVGRILLAADLQLKKDTASYTSPETTEGRAYWDKLYAKAKELYGIIPEEIPTMVRPWIVPNEIIIRETNGSAYIYKATLKVMLEQDYFRLQTEDHRPQTTAHGELLTTSDERRETSDEILNEYAAELMRRLIIPRINKDINNSRRYAALRQVYYSLIMAQWFKSRFAGKGGAYCALIDRQNLSGLTSKQPWSKAAYFKEYQKSFKEGGYQIKEPVYTTSGQSLRTYVSGGVNEALSIPPPAEKIGGFNTSGPVKIEKGNEETPLPEDGMHHLIISGDSLSESSGSSAHSAIAVSPQEMEQISAMLDKLLWTGKKRKLKDDTERRLLLRGFLYGDLLESVIRMLSLLNQSELDKIEAVLNKLKTASPSEAEAISGIMSPLQTKITLERIALRAKFIKLSPQEQKFLLLTLLQEEGLRKLAAGILAILSSPEIAKLRSMAQNWNGGNEAERDKIQAAFEFALNTSENLRTDELPSGYLFTQSRLSLFVRSLLHPEEKSFLRSIYDRFFPPFPGFPRRGIRYARMNRSMSLPIGEKNKWFLNAPLGYDTERPVYNLEEYRGRNFICWFEAEDFLSRDQAELSEIADLTGKEMGIKITPEQILSELTARMEDILKEALGFEKPINQISFLSKVRIWLSIRNITLPFTKPLYYLAGEWYEDWHRTKTIEDGRYVIERSRLKAFGRPDVNLIYCDPQNPSLLRTLRLNEISIELAKMGVFYKGPPGDGGLDEAQDWAYWDQAYPVSPKQFWLNHVASRPPRIILEKIPEGGYKYVLENGLALSIPSNISVYFKEAADFQETVMPAPEEERGEFSTDEPELIVFPYEIRGNLRHDDPIFNAIATLPDCSIVERRTGETTEVTARGDSLSGIRLYKKGSLTTLSISINIKDAGLYAKLLDSGANVPRPFAELEEVIFTEYLPLGLSQTAPDLIANNFYYGGLLINELSKMHRLKIRHGHPRFENLRFYKQTVKLFDFKYVTENPGLRWDKPEEVFNFFESEYGFLIECLRGIKLNERQVVTLFNKLVEEYPCGEKDKSALMQLIKPRITAFFPSDDDHAPLTIHASWSAINTDHPRYNVDSIRQGFGEDGKVKINTSEDLKRFIAFLGDKVARKQISVQERNINIVIENDLSAMLSDGNIGALIQEALARAGGDINNLPDTLVFAFLDQSSHIFEDHLRNGFIGVNRIINEIAEPKARAIMLKTGMVHELAHEVTRENDNDAFENVQLGRDALYAFELMRKEGVSIVDLKNELIEKGVLKTVQYAANSPIETKFTKAIKSIPASYAGWNASLEDIIALAEKYYNKGEIENKLIAGDLALQALNKIMRERTPYNISPLLPILENFESLAFDSTGTMTNLVKFLKSTQALNETAPGELRPWLEAVNNLNERTELSVRVSEHERGRYDLLPPLGALRGVIVDALEKDPETKKQTGIYEELFTLCDNMSDFIHTSGGRLYRRKSGEYNQSLNTFSVMEAAQWRKSIRRTIEIFDNNELPLWFQNYSASQFVRDYVYSSLKNKATPLITGEPILKDFDLREVTQTAASDLYVINDTSVILEIFPSSGPLNIHADEDMIYTVIKTMIKNSTLVAEERMEEENEARRKEGKEELTLKDNPVKLTLKFWMEGEDLAMQVIELNDNVGGISDLSLLEETYPGSGRQKITEPNLSRRKKDTGFGLACVWHIANIHGGTFWIRNIGDTPGKGIVAEIRIPLKNNTGNTQQNDNSPAGGTPPVERSSSAPATSPSEQTENSSAVHENEKGGIDFISLPVVAQTAVNPDSSSGFPEAKCRHPDKNINFDEEWLRIKNMINNEILPSAERVRELTNASCYDGMPVEARKQILACVMNILRLEENDTRGTPAEFYETLSVLEKAG